MQDNFWNPCKTYPTLTIQEETFNKLVLTRVDCEIDGDIFYPDIDIGNWELVKSHAFNKDDENDFNYKIEEYKRL